MGMYHINLYLYRNEVECNLTFLGFIIFENKLKLRTTSALTTLRNANIRQIMCTGNVNVYVFVIFIIIIN